MSRINQQPALVLQSRPYRETSALVHLFSRDFGRVWGVWRGVRGGKRHSVLAAQTFALSRASWYGKGSGLVTLSQLETEHQRWLTGTAAVVGFYVTELLVRLLGERDPHPGVFVAADNALTQLAAVGPAEPPLRVLEKRLMDEMGYGLDWVREAGTRERVQADRLYRVDPSLGVVLCDNENTVDTYAGVVLQGIHNELFDHPQVARAAKTIFRRCLEPHLGSRPLRSRSLAQQLR